MRSKVNWIFGPQNSNHRFPEKNLANPLWCATCFRPNDMHTTRFSSRTVSNLMNPNQGPSKQILRAETYKHVANVNVRSIPPTPALKIQPKMVGFRQSPDGLQSSVRPSLPKGLADEPNIKLLQADDKDAKKTHVLHQNRPPDADRFLKMF